MTTFNLKSFPLVCRLCLQSKPQEELLSLDSFRLQFGKTIAEMLELVTFKVPEEQLVFLPMEICEECLGVFEFFYKYKRKIHLIQRFSFGLAEIKCGNPQAMHQLFELEGDQLKMLFKDLNLCTRENVEAEDLLAEFDQYEISSAICVKIESDSETDGGLEVEEPDLDGLIKQDYEIFEITKIPRSLVEETDRSELSEKLSLEEISILDVSDPSERIKDVHFVQVTKNEHDVHIQKSLTDVEMSSIIDSTVEENISDFYGETVGPEEDLISNTLENQELQSDNESSDDDGEQCSEYTLMEAGEDCDLMQDEDEEPAEKKRRKNLRLREEAVDEQHCTIEDCKFSTDRPSRFEKHLRKRHPKKLELLSCFREGCKGELFPSRELLIQHKNDFHNTHICVICDKVMRHLVAYENHVRSHERKRESTIKCGICKELFCTEPELQRHAVKQHAVRFLFECQECGLGFKQKMLLNQHMLTHSVERNFNCEQCGMGFKTANHMRRHARTVHSEIRFACEHCPMSYGRRDKLRMHMEKVHDIQTYFVCDICCVTFETNDKLEEHKQRHESPQEMECGICLAACTTPKEFNEHMCITYQDNYVCCGRDFRYHSFFNRHMFLTHGVSINARVKPKAGVLMGKQRAMRKPVERCTKCEYVFATRKLKKQHMESCEGQVVIFEIEPVGDDKTIQPSAEV
ncbi:putative zinc finger protein 286B [Uranotaenia lowii]|uniref:putative zinc finger protein 286B n=1 Tax=Uranotaenia lowii TaxID=190385 RepID=UPI002478E1CA|nr:putative zinc finger protein 286B [Uranotaenia lowii]